MYVLIDREQMAIVHKHAVREVLNDLSWIECTNSALTLPLGRAEHWTREFSPSELRLIYKNSTGAEIQGYGHTLGHVVNQMAMRLPETDCVPDEVRAQRLCVMDGDKSSYSYVKGSMRPAGYPGLFTPDPLACARSEAEEATAAASKPTHVPSAPSSGAGGGVGAVQGTAQRAPSAPRVGGSRETIFRVADEMWDAAGKPSEVKAVLELRRQIMSVLEAHHEIKKTTSSTALGDWQKSRLS